LASTAIATGANVAPPAVSDATVVAGWPRRGRRRRTACARQVEDVQRLREPAGRRPTATALTRVRARPGASGWGSGGAPARSAGPPAADSRHTRFSGSP